MDALYFRVSSDRQTTENQFEDLLQTAEKDDSVRDWNQIRQLLSQAVYQEEASSSRDGSRPTYRIRPEVVAELAGSCVYVEQGRSGRAGARRRPLFEQMKQDAVQRKFDRLLVWKVSRLGRDMREVIATVNQLADLGVTVVPVKSQTGPISSPMGKLLWAIQVWFAEMENSERSEAIRAGQARARAAGKSIGRPKVVFRRDLVAELRRQGSSWRRIARELDADVGTVRRAYLLNCGSTAACQNCGDVVLDCGADVGVYTREALVQGARLVVAIEPSPLNLECLRRNLAAETAAGRVIIYEKGVWDKDDFLTITVVPGNPAADTFVMNPQGGQAGPKLPRTSIDKLVAELKLDRVDYIKMDIEGAEQRAIRGAAETLRRFHPRLALSSYHLAEDPEKIPELVRSAWSGYRMECGPCTWANGIVRPDVLYFR